MAWTQIVDGTGKKFAARVNDEFQLETIANTQPRVSFVSEHHEMCFALSTSGFIALTTTGDHGILFIKNTDPNKHLHIQDIKISSSVSGVLAKLYKNPSTGTLISGAVAAGVSNLNFSSTKEAIINCYKGVDGATITNGSVFDQFIVGSSPTIVQYDGALILPSMSSIAIAVNISSAASIGCRILGFFEQNE